MNYDIFSVYIEVDFVHPNVLCIHEYVNVDSLSFIVKIYVARCFVNGDTQILLVFNVYTDRSIIVDYYLNTEFVNFDKGYGLVGCKDINIDNYFNCSFHVYICPILFSIHSFWNNDF